MIFQFETNSYFYTYHPDVVVFEKIVLYGNKPVTLYKLVIGDEDEIFDVIRIR
jgi:hypothetical protein